VQHFNPAARRWRVVSAIETDVVFSMAARRMGLAYNFRKHRQAGWMLRDACCAAPFQARTAMG